MVYQYRVDRWTIKGYLKDVKEVLEGWDLMCWKIVSKTPEDKLVDWKLVYRDPLPNWVSGYGTAPGHGKICLLGDAAHPFLPTSVQGATQALERWCYVRCTAEKGREKEHPEWVESVSGYKIRQSQSSIEDG